MRLVAYPTLVQMSVPSSTYHVHASGEKAFTINIDVSETAIPRSRRSIRPRRRGIPEHGP
jgi:hypothetical protein